MFKSNPKFKKIVVYNKFFSGDRDALSLYFDYAGEGTIKVNRFYYNSRSYIDFLKLYYDNESLINYRNIKVSSVVLEKDEFINIFIKFVSELRDYRDKTDLLLVYASELRQTSYADESEESNDVEIILDKINSALVGYQCRFGNNGRAHVFNNELIEELDSSLHLVPASEHADDIAIHAALPEQYQKIDEPSLYELRVYDVGQANCSALIKYTDASKKDYKVVVVFDFGLENGKTNASLSQMINKIDNDTTIIISHFDIDHINNISKFTLKTTCRWLFPEHEPVKEKANLLYHNLLRVASRKSVSGTNVFSYKAPFDLSSYLKIYQNTEGKKDYRYQSTIINSQCIIASLNINNIKVLIPADALYRDFPNEVFDLSYNYVLIPHHGCRYMDPTNIASPYCDKIKKIVHNNPTAFVMSGFDGIRHGHSNTKHLRWYNNVSAFKNTAFFSSKGHFDSAYTCNKVLSNYWIINFI